MRDTPPAGIVTELIETIPVPVVSETRTFEPGMISFTLPKLSAETVNNLLSN